MEEYDKDNVVAVIEQDLKDYDKSLLHTASIEDALIRDKVYLDANILTNAADVLSRYPDISSIPVLTDDDRILYLASSGHSPQFIGTPIFSQISPSANTSIPFSCKKLWK